MSTRRIKVSGAYNDFERKLSSLKHFDSRNQKLFGAGQLSSKQFEILTESTFFRAFREYENLVRDLFLLYTQEKARMNGTSVKSFLKPSDFYHAEDMIRSSSRFLDWNSPDAVIERAELFLEEGFPIKLPYSTSRVLLMRYKDLRNHIAHNSVTSLKSYKKALLTYYGVLPATIPSVGRYLLLTSKDDPSKYHLMEFFDNIQNIANEIK